MRCTWYMSSGTVMIDRITVSLVRMIEKLTSAGSAETRPSGRRMRRTIVCSAMPMARAASIWPCGTARKPERKISAK